MRYKVLQDLGIPVDPGYSILLDTVVFLCCCLVICGGSWILLKKKRFRAHIVFLLLVAVLLVLPQFFWDLPQGMYGNDVLLLLCAWDHYWARAKLGQVPLPLKKARKIEGVVAVILSACFGLCWLKIGIFQQLNESVLLVSAGYLWFHLYYHRDDFNGEKSLFP